MLFERGANAKQVQRWLGHHSASFTLDTYIHLMRDDLAEPLSRSSELAPVEPSGALAISDEVATEVAPEPTELGRNPAAAFVTQTAL